MLKKLADLTGRKSQGHNSLNDLTAESKPTIVISAEEESFCQLANINIAATSLIGYNKMEVLNINIRGIMPKMYA